MQSKVDERTKIVDGKRCDGRGLTELRPLRIKAGVLEKADGSALVEWGRNKVLAAVYGPHEVFPKHLTNPYKAIIAARYIMAPFSGQEEHGRAGPNRRSIEISKVARHVFENVVLVQQFPKTMIDVHMEVLQSDGGTRIAAITAAGVALADAGIPMRDIPCGVSIGKIDGKIVVDLNKDEDNYGQSDMPFVFAPRTGEILLFQMDGMLNKEEVAEGMKLALEAARSIHELQAAALKEKYAATSASEQEVGEQSSEQQ
ncbi:MAG: exosome complex exonuclease Rrp41 [Candidatus Norongarragalinales archaeon]